MTAVTSPVKKENSDESIRADGRVGVFNIMGQRQIVHNGSITIDVDLKTFTLPLTIDHNSETLFSCRVKPRITAENNIQNSCQFNAIVTDSNGTETDIIILVLLRNEIDFHSIKNLVTFCDRMESVTTQQLQISAAAIENGFVELRMNCFDGRLLRYNDRYLAIDYKYHTSSSQQLQWKHARASLVEMDEPFYLRVCRSHCNYRLSIIASMIDPTTDAIIYEPSQPLIIDIPNERVQTQWEVGQSCKFLHPDKTFTPGIIEASTDKGYRVRDNIESKTFVVSAAQLRCNSKYWYQWCDISDWAVVDKCLIYGGCTDEAMCAAVHQTLVECVSQYLDVAVSHPDSTERTVSITANRGSDHVVITTARMLSIGVIGYLFDPPLYQWRIRCEECDAQHIRSNFAFEFGLHGTGRFTSSVCSHCVGEYLFSPGFKCRNSDNHKSGVKGSRCMECIYSVVCKHRYWTETLTPLLQNRLPTDCILTLVSYVGGSASFVHLSI